MDAPRGGQGGYRPRIVFLSGLDIPTGRGPDTPAWVSDPSFALWTGTYAVAAAHPVRSRIKRARVDAAAGEDDDIPGLRRVRGRSNRSGDDCCAICLHDLRADDTLGAMPCSHACFHHRCISQWIRRNAVCPLCRHRLPAFEDEDDDEEVEEEEEEVAPELEEEVAPELEEEDEIEWIDGGIECS